jgi:ribosomal protein L29
MTDKELNDEIRELEAELLDTEYGDRYDELDSEIDTLSGLEDLKPRGEIQC